MAPLLAPAQSGNDPAAEVAVDAAWAELVDVYQVGFRVWACEKRCTMHFRGTAHTKESALVAK